MRDVRLLSVLLSSTLMACSSVGSGQGSSRGAGVPEPVDVTQWSGDLPISAPWLREQLPATALVYQLNETQRVDFSSAVLAATGSARNLPQAMYNGYIGLMQGLADMVDVDYDIWSMPTASQLGLPDRGALGASVSLGEPYVAFELSYESHPAELLFGGGGMAAMAVAGIAAAIALPAFQDYTERAQAVEAVSRSAAGNSAADASAVQ
jgi:hypothetical protein